MGSSTEYSAYQITHNPDLTRVPGVHGGPPRRPQSLPLGLGTTQGVNCQPAAFCGVVGLKPTFGRVSAGVWWPWLLLWIKLGAHGAHR